MSPRLPKNISADKNNTILRIKDDEALVKKFMRERDVPNWFRGMSKFQLDAADSLLNCIRDDSEQATSHRVKDALRRIGIEPLVCGSKIKFAMQLSRGNDIAFLWFLMELYYRSSIALCEQKKFTVNEQIFITTIAHLDTIPTLRELDRILPKQPDMPTKKKTLQKRVTRQHPVLPYLEKQRRPVAYGKILTMNEIDKVASFVEYEKYLDPNYVVPNEFNRWFAFYNLKKSERIAKGIIKDQIEDIFEKEDEGTLEEDGKRMVFCSHHQTLEALKESIANELLVVKRRACEKYFDVNGQLKYQSCKRVMFQLNKDIQKAEEHFKKLASEQKSFCCVKKDEQPIDTKARKQVHCEDSQSCKDQENLYDYGHAAVFSGKCNYFNASTCNKPYKFNYEKIFDFGIKDPVKEAVASALNADSSCNLSVEHKRAIRKCCKNIWAQEVKSYNTKYENNQRVIREKAGEGPAEQNILRLDPSFDPRNTTQVHSLLLTALGEIKKNKKFVLASLPDSHKFPILREWVKKRYGMVYTRQEKREGLKLAKKVFQVLRKNALRVKIPHLNELATKRIVSYKCKDYLLKKTNYLKEKYYRDFKASLLEDTRVYWQAVRPYQCPKGPPRREFFAYMPSRKNDVHVFRPWKADEHLRAKEEWDKRQRVRRMELLY